MAKKIMAIPKNIFFFIAIALLGGFAGSSLLHRGLIPTHDGEYHVVRFFEFNKVLQDGILYPRWAPDLNLGYGVPLFNYVYPFPNFFASLLHMFGISFIDTFKISMFIAWIVSGIFFFLWVKIFWGNIGGFVSSVLYMYSPYHIVDIYVRGSVGEVWALTFFPLFLWAITEYIDTRKKLYFVLSTISLSLIIFSHNILAVMFLPFVILYVFFLIFRLKKKNNAFKMTVIVFSIGIGLSAIFWMPALFEKQLVTGLQIFEIENNFPELYQYIFPSWGSGFVNGDLQNQMSVQIGAVNLLVLIVSIPVIFQLFKRRDNRAYILLYFYIGFIIIIFLLQKISFPLWNTIPLMNYFQFPWRFLSLIILITSFIGGCVVTIKYKKLLSAVFVFLAVFSTISYIKPAYFLDRDDSYYIQKENFIHGSNSPGNAFNTIWMQSKGKREGKIVRLSSSITDMEETISSSNYYSVKGIFKTATTAVAQIAYFPGWKVWIDNKEVSVSYNKEGLLSFIVPSGPHVINIQFTDTIIRNIASGISVLTFLALLMITLKLKK